MGCQSALFILEIEYSAKIFAKIKIPIKSKKKKRKKILRYNLKFLEILKILEFY